MILLSWSPIAMALYRMIAIDLDGTLLAPDGTVSPRAKAAVHKALAAGLLVCFATGRNYTESQMVLEAVAHYDTAVFVGGAMVIDTSTAKRCIAWACRPNWLARLRIIRIARPCGPGIQDTAAAGVDYLVDGRRKTR